MENKRASASITIRKAMFDMENGRMERELIGFQRKNSRSNNFKYKIKKAVDLKTLFL